MKAKSNNYRGKVDISVSQNFITSKNTIYKLIKKTNISKNDFVIEIGPGKGHITEALWEKSYWVTADEGILGLGGDGDGRTENGDGEGLGGQCFRALGICGSELQLIGALLHGVLGQ